VLIVEDNADVRDMLRVLLEVDGHEVHEAEDEPTAALAARPDVAFIDIGLPSMDGYELVQHIRTRAEGPLPILVVLPGYGRSENRQRISGWGSTHTSSGRHDPDRIREIMHRAPHRVNHRTSADG
jgi:CheY-like chemotaxis protein